VATAFLVSDCVLVGVGAFGEQVARQLAAQGAAGEPLAGRDPGAVIDRAFTDGAATAVLALWRPSAALCEQVDDLAFAHGRSWLPVILEHPNLLVGPLVSPGAGPCFRCYQKRRAQHDPHRSVRAKLEAAFDADPSLGPAGYLPHHARTAVGLAELMLSRVPGEVAQVGLLSGRTSSQRLIAVHGCPRCGPDHPVGRNRALADLVPLREKG
jgi:bacteriocin biosynthesis cyclodehydratase domain-containing protein